MTFLISDDIDISDEKIFTPYKKNAIPKGEITTETFIFHGKKRSGKTMSAILFALKYDRVYSNVDFYIYGIKKNYSIVSFGEFEKIIEFDDRKGIMILDEAGFQFTAKDGDSKLNKAISRFSMLAGKNNLDLIYITQRFERLEPDARTQSDYIFETKKLHRRGINRPLFVIQRQRLEKRDGIDTLIFEEENIVDTLGLFAKLSVTYNTLDTSIITL